jgi:PIN like domain
VEVSNYKHVARSFSPLQAPAFFDLSQYSGETLRSAHLLTILNAMIKPKTRWAEIRAIAFYWFGELGWFLVTQDKKIKRKKHELEALRRAGLGAFIFTGRAERDIDSMMMLVLKSFNEMQRLATQTKRPFIFGISDRGSIDRLD